MPDPSPASFFAHPSHSLHRRYEVLRAFFHEGLTAEQTAARFGYSIGSVYAITRDFRHLDDPAAFFFREPRLPGRTPDQAPASVRERIIALRKANLSLPDIKARLDAECDQAPSQRGVWRVLREEGFARLPRRTRSERAAAATPPLSAPASSLLDPASAESFLSERAAGALCLLPWIRAYGLDAAIQRADFPATTSLPALQSVLAFVALKLSDFRRYSADDLWCMDRGLGLFAGLNVLPKTASLSAYSDRTIHPMHQSLLGSLAAIWTDKGLVGDTANLDFTTLPHWGDDETLTKHWSSTRGRALIGISAALAQDPDSGLLLRADAGGRDSSGDDSVLEFLHFSQHNGLPVRYLVFDSRFTTYANLARLDKAGILFVTVRRRGKHLLAKASQLAKAALREVRVPAGSGTRLVSAHDETVPLRGFGGDLRQITILRSATQRPCFLITNDFDAPLASLLRRYARRWLVEQSIAEQLAFFHLNRLSSAMVIKVDFDLTMTILAYNLLRLLALDLPPGYRHLTARSLYEKFLCNAAEISLLPDRCVVSLKKKRDLPALLQALQTVSPCRIPWLGNREIVFQGATTS